MSASAAADAHLRHALFTYWANSGLFSTQSNSPHADEIGILALAIGLAWCRSIKMRSPSATVQRVGRDDDGIRHKSSTNIANISR